MTDISRVEAHNEASHAPEIDPARVCTPDRLITTGRTSEIYRMPDGRILKRFLPGVPLERIEREAQTACYTEEQGLPVPRIDGRVRCNQGEAIIYEKIEGRLLLQELAAHPWMVITYARLTADLHARVHALRAPLHLTPQRERAAGPIHATNKLPVRLRDGVLRLLDELPDGDRLCHGDFHPANIILTKRGPFIIDWMHASAGVPEGDVARTSVILEAGTPPVSAPLHPLLEQIRRLMLSTYLQAYAALRPLDMDAYSSWRTVMAANFLAEFAQPEEEPALLRIVGEGLRGPGFRS